MSSQPPTDEAATAPATGPKSDAGATTATRDLSIWRVAWRTVRHEPRSFAIGSAWFYVFFLMPAVVGWVLSRGFDRLGDGDPASAYRWAGVLLVAEGVRMASLQLALPTYMAAWVHMLTITRGNMLAAQLVSGGDEAGRPTSSAGESITTFRDDAEEGVLFIDFMVDTSGGAALTLVMGGVLAATNLSGALLLIVPLSMVAAVALGLQQRVRNYRLADRAAAAQVSGLVGDVMSAATAVRVNDAVDDVVDELATRAEVRRHTATRDRVLSEAIFRFGDGAVDLAIGGVVAVSAAALVDGSFDVAGLALFISYLGWLTFFPRMLGRLLAARRQIEVTYDRMAELVADERYSHLVLPRDLPLEAHQGAYQPEERRPDRTPLEVMCVDELSVRFDDVTVLADVGFEIRRGEVVVITGPVGAGKSSLLRAVLGLSAPEVASATVRWNGAVLDDRAAFLVPPNAAFLPQVPQLISDSVADNIALGALPVADVEAALELAELGDDLADMVDGPATMIGPRGLRLSGGQRQRLAAARAIVRRPELLVLDDLSSALDVETEQRLWDRFAAAGLTVLAVSHREVALRRADRVLRIDDGRVQEA